MSKKNIAIASRFLRKFYGDAVSKEGRFAIWTKHNKGHQFFSGIDTALKDLDYGRDTYFTMAIYPAGVRTRKIHTARAIFGVWLDIDCGKEGTYFATISDALDWVTDALAGYWSIIVCSGGGVHVYLLFDEPFWIESDEDRIRASRIVKSFHSWVAGRCPYTVDSVTDLARVMRLPGSMNTRVQKPCYVVDENDYVIAMSDLEEQIPLIEVTEKRQESDIDGDVDFDDVKSMLSIQRDIDSTFDRTWKRQRRLRDQSPSGYCMSIANHLAAVGFKDVEIKAALKMWRDGQTDAEEKPDSWYARTIMAARSAARHEVVGQQVTAALDTPDTEEQIEKISLVLGRKLRKIYKRIAPRYKGRKEKASYVFNFDDETTLEVPNTEVLMSQAKMRQHVFEEIEVLMQRLKSPQWDDFLRLVLMNAQVVETELEANTAFHLEEELKVFVNKKRKNNQITSDISVLTDSNLYEQNGTVYFKWRTFKRHLLSTGFSSMQHAKLSELLTGLGCKSTQLSVGSRPRMWGWSPEGEGDEESN